MEAQKILSLFTDCLFDVINSRIPCINLEPVIEFVCNGINIPNSKAKGWNEI
jgi:hypothetical protein